MQPDIHYHIYTHANGFENLFQSQENYGYFLRRYEHFIPPIADTLAYCLMPNHIHFLIRVKTETEIESFFKDLQGFKNLQQDRQQDLQGFKNLGGLNIKNDIEKRISQQFINLFNSYTKAYNKMYSRRGSLFIPNFKRKEINSDSYLTNLIHYIHANPVHHGFINKLSDWRWSSYNVILSDEPHFIKREEVIQWFGNREAYLQFHQQTITVKQAMDF